MAVNRCVMLRTSMYERYRGGEPETNLRRNGNGQRWCAVPRIKIGGEWACMGRVWIYPGVNLTNQDGVVGIRL
jgi:hypothetical protein